MARTTPPLYIRVHFPGEPLRKRFNFPVDLCFSDQFHLQLRRNLERLKLDNPNASPDTFWELVKPCIRGSALGFKKLHSIYRKELIESLECKLATVQHESALEENFLIRASHWEQAEELKKQLHDVYTELTEDKYAFNLARWYSQEGCTTKYFLSKFKQDRKHVCIAHLQTENGMVDTNDEILKEAVRFYTILYEKSIHYIPSENLDEVSQLSQAHYLLLDKPISVEELHEAVKCMKTTSAPGSDGLTVKFYLHFGDEIKEFLLAAFNCALQKGHLSVSQRLGLIRLIPKKLQNLLLIINWRPIALLNMDYKILTKLFVLQLRHILPDIIHPDQRGFIHGCRLDHGILDIYALLDLVDHDQMDGLLCTIDIAKAFDSLDWDFVKYALRLYGFPESFIKWFDILCSNKEIRIVNNGQWSDSIKVHKGSAQGCPLSPLLFILSIEIWQLELGVTQRF